ncbi:hypothetical protein Nepgr_016383 [Nepenthes gracilis]|uniref:Uncharacterized protein n=1 Tax=Nepenthes gracilis TaxID=150966 RepID=A0AAD3SP35_NEPGR|nr:hypothetical protein Nepgr_016383 [Nepenthes gracilis]
MLAEADSRLSVMAMKCHKSDSRFNAAVHLTDREILCGLGAELFDRVLQLALPNTMVSPPDNAESPASHQSSSSESGYPFLTHFLDRTVLIRRLVISPHCGLLSALRIGSGTNFSSSIEVDVSYQWKPKRMNIDNHLEGRILSAPSAPGAIPVSANPLKNLMVAPAPKVEPGVVLDQKVPSFQLVCILESNVPPNSYAAMPKCGLDNSLPETMHSPPFVPPRPLNGLDELEVSGQSRVIISSPPGDAQGEVAFRALSSSGEVSIACLNDATLAEDVVLTKTISSGSRAGEDHDCRLVVDSQAPLSDAVSLFDVRSYSEEVMLELQMLWFRSREDCLIKFVEAISCLEIVAVCSPDLLDPSCSLGLGSGLRCHVLRTLAGWSLHPTEVDGCRATCCGSFH